MPVKPVVLEGSSEMAFVAGFDAHDAESVKRRAADPRALILNQKEFASMPPCGMGAYPRNAIGFRIGT